MKQSSHNVDEVEAMFIDGITLDQKSYRFSGERVHQECVSVECDDRDAPDVHVLAQSVRRIYENARQIPRDDNA